MIATASGLTAASESGFIIGFLLGQGSMALLLLWLYGRRKNNGGKK